MSLRQKILDLHLVSPAFWQTRLPTCPRSSTSSVSPPSCEAADSAARTSEGCRWGRGQTTLWLSWCLHASVGSCTHQLMSRAGNSRTSQPQQSLGQPFPFALWLIPQNFIYMKFFCTVNDTTSILLWTQVKNYIFHLIWVKLKLNVTLVSMSLKM